MDKSLVGHAAVALVALGIAYAAWQKPADSPKANVVMVPGSVDRLTQVEWDEPGFHVTLDRHGDAMTISSTNQNDDKRSVSAFPVSDKGQTLLGKLAPFKAERSLGKPDEARAKEIGLDAKPQSLTLHFGNNVTKLDVGNATFGGANYYVRTPTGEVFLVSSLAITPLLNGGAALVERGAVNLTREHVEQIVIKSDGSTRTLVHKNAGDRTQSFFADVAAPDVKLEKANGWVDSVLRLRALSAAPQEPTTEPKLELTLRGDDGKARSVKLWAPEGDTAVVTSTTFPKGIVVAKSTAELLLKDAKQVLGDGKTSDEPPADARAQAR